ncbi:MAG: hypothetical protein RQ990_05260 [Candidatus Hydrothermia bacterium]|nr:hypothetical protein [Candidatus Hydrothermia bacterium]
MSHYNYKELFRAFRLGLSIKKLVIIYPLSILLFLLYSKFDILIFVIFSIYYFFSKIAISKITYEQIKGDHFYEIKRAFKFSIKAFLTFIYFLILMLFLFSITFLLFYLFVIISKINKILLYISFPFIFILAILMFYILVGLVMSENVGISAISSQNYDAFDIFFENFSIFNSQVYRFLAYKIISIFISIFGAILLLTIAFILIKFINYFLKLNELHILYFLVYLIAISYGFSVYFVSDFISYLIFVYKRDNFDLSKLEPEIHSQRT